MSAPRSPSTADEPRVLDERRFRAAIGRSSLALGFALGLPILVLLGLVLFLLRSADLVDHTDRLISKANRTEKLLVTMQTSFRGFRLSNDEKFLVAYRAAKSEIEPHWEAMAALVSDDAEKNAKLQIAKKNAQLWAAFIDEQIAVVRSGQTHAQDTSFLARGAPLFDSVMAPLDVLIADAEHLRAAREERLKLVSTVLLLSLGFAAVVGVPLLGVWLRRLLHQINESYRTTLAASQARETELQVTLNSIGDAVIATDARGAVTFLNPIAESLMGWSSGEARGRMLTEVFDIYNERTGEPAANPVERVLRENVIVGLANHTVLRSRSGREYPIEDSAAPIRDGRGEVKGVILVFHDVTEKHAAERDLQASEQRLRFLNELGEATRSIADPAEIMAATARMLGQHLRVSRCAYADVEADGDRFTILHDYTDACVSTVGTYYLSLFGDRAVANLHGGATLVLNHVDRELEADAPAVAMFKALGIQGLICCPLIKDGNLRAMMAVHQVDPRTWSAREIQLVQEVVDRCWATIERARAENEARVRADRFRVLSEVVSLQVWSAAPDGGLTWANQECGAYFGANLARDVLGNGWAQFVHSEDLPAALQLWTASLSSGERYEVKFRLRRAGGEYRWFLVRAEAVRDGSGAIVAWFGTNTDVQDLQHAQDVAESASRAKDSFLAALSHELRTPLTPVLMGTSVLQRDDRLPVDVREQLGMIGRNVALEARLIDDLLDLTRVAQGKLHLRSEPCDAHSLIDLALEIVRDDAHTKKLSIARDFAAGRSGIVADPARFQQVIWNLLRNAVKFTPERGKITIRTRNQADSSLRIEVTDTGIGIEPDEFAHIFQPFEQGGLTGHHQFGGLGLGLSIARAIVDFHGGKLSAESAGRGQGATFVVELPTGAASSTVTQEIDVAPAASDLEKKSASLRLLLVEDHEDSRLVMQVLLSGAGHQVASVATVEEALARAAGQTFDFVISDLGLPDGSGNELMEKLRDLYGLRGVALSGFGMAEDMERSHRAGFVAHLTKPVDFAQLQRALAAFV